MSPNVPGLLLGNVQTEGRVDGSEMWLKLQVQAYGEDLPPSPAHHSISPGQHLLCSHVQLQRAAGLRVLV